YGLLWIIRHCHRKLSGVGRRRSTPKPSCGLVRPKRYGTRAALAFDRVFTHLQQHQLLLQATLFHIFLKPTLISGQIPLSTPLLTDARFQRVEITSPSSSFAAPHHDDDFCEFVLPVMVHLIPYTEMVLTVCPSLMILLSYSSWLIEFLLSSRKNRN